MADGYIRSPFLQKRNQIVLSDRIEPVAVYFVEKNKIYTSSILACILLTQLGLLLRFLQAISNLH